jgi:hypothetical protein
LEQLGHQMGVLDPGLVVVLRDDKACMIGIDVMHPAEAYPAVNIDAPARQWTLPAQ